MEGGGGEGRWGVEDTTVSTVTQAPPFTLGVCSIREQVIQCTLRNCSAYHWHCKNLTHDKENFQLFALLSEIFSNQTLYQLVTEMFILTSDLAIVLLIVNYTTLFTAYPLYMFNRPVIPQEDETRAVVVFMNGRNKIRGGIHERKKQDPWWYS